MRKLIQNPKLTTILKREQAKQRSKPSVKNLAGQRTSNRTKIEEREHVPYQQNVQANYRGQNGMNYRWYKCVGKRVSKTAARTSTQKAGTYQIRSWRARLGQARSVQVRSGQVRSDQVCSLWLTLLSFSPIPFPSVQLHSHLLSFVSVHSVFLPSIQFQSIQFCALPFNSAPFRLLLLPFL